MSKHTHANHDVKCDACAKEIPESAAMTVEGLEYVLHFCGQPCFDHWERERKQKESNNPQK